MKKAALLIPCSFLGLHPVGFSQSDSNAVCKNPNSPIPLRVRDPLNKMTVEEKVAQLESGWTLPAFGTDNILPPNSTSIKTAARRGYIFTTIRCSFPSGLSYTTFSFGMPKLDRDQISPKETTKGADQLSILNAQMQRTVEPGAVDIMGEAPPDTSATRRTIC